MKQRTMPPRRSTRRWAARNRGADHLVLQELAVIAARRRDEDAIGRPLP